MKLIKAIALVNLVVGVVVLSGIAVGVCRSCAKK
jgi:hypothetical protein